MVYLQSLATILLLSNALLPSSAERWQQVTVKKGKVCKFTDKSHTADNSWIVIKTIRNRKTCKQFCLSERFSARCVAFEQTGDQCPLLKNAVKGFKNPPKSGRRLQKDDNDKNDKDKNDKNNDKDDKDDKDVPGDDEEIEYRCGIVYKHVVEDQPSAAPSNSPVPKKFVTKEGAICKVAAGEKRRQKKIHQC